jgi:hypothetical protein
MGGTYSGIREMRKAYKTVVRKHKWKTTPSLEAGKRIILKEVFKKKDMRVLTVFTGT